MSLTDQLAMNRESWAALQQHGVDEQSELRLEFMYRAPGSREAVELATLLQRQTDYEVGTEEAEDGAGWELFGITQPTHVSLDILDRWAEWMHAAGERCGCEFDGWGAEVGE